MQAFSFRRIFQTLLIPVLAVFTALRVGAIIMLIFGDNPLAGYRGSSTARLAPPRIGPRRSAE